MKVELIIATLVVFQIASAEYVSQNRNCKTGRQTICKMSDGEQGCCPYYNGTCCLNGEGCCPNGYDCDEASEMCRNGLKQQVLQQMKTDNPKNVQYVICPDGSACYDGQTCCPYISGGYACCPFSYATCCSDRQTCCPLGYICSGTACYADEKNFPFLKKHGKTITQTMAPLKRA